MKLKQLLHLLAIALGFILLGVIAANGGEKKAKRKADRNYILRRQEAYQVRGVPVRRLIIGKREVDIYRDGTAYEKDNRSN